MSVGGGGTKLSRILSLTPDTAQEDVMQFGDEPDRDWTLGWTIPASLERPDMIGDFLETWGDVGFVLSNFEQDQFIELGAGFFDPTRCKCFTSNEGTDEKMWVGKHAAKAVETSQRPCRHFDACDEFCVERKLR